MSLARIAVPYNFGPGIVAEGVPTLWRLIAGADAERWNAKVARQSR